MSIHLVFILIAWLGSTASLLHLVNKWKERALSAEKLVNAAGRLLCEQVSQDDIRMMATKGEKLYR